MALDCLVRAWRIQLAVWTAGGRLSWHDALRLNLYGEAASQLTPNRLGGEPARLMGLTEAGLRPVTGLVAIGVEVAGEWPVFLGLGAALFVHYVPDWQDAGGHWLRRHRAGDFLGVTGAQHVGGELIAEMLASISVDTFMSTYELSAG